MAYSNWYHPKIQRKSAEFADSVDLGTDVLVGGESVTANAHEINTLDLNATGGVTRYMKISMVAADFDDNSEVETGYVLPEFAIVKNVLVRVNAEETTAVTKTIDVGTDSNDGGDADGFLAGVSVATEGLVKGSLVDGAQTLGALLYVDEGGTGELVPEVDIASGGKEITVTAGDAGGFDEAEFDIFIEYILVA